MLSIEFYYANGNFQEGMGLGGEVRHHLTVNFNESISQLLSQFQNDSNLAGIGNRLVYNSQRDFA